MKYKNYLKLNKKILKRHNSKIKLMIMKKIILNFIHKQNKNKKY